MTTYEPTEIETQVYEQAVHGKLCGSALSSVRFAVVDPVLLSVAVPFLATNLKVSFDPVLMQEAQQTRELNEAIRLGFMPPAASTR